MAIQPQYSARIPCRSSILTIFGQVTPAGQFSLALSSAYRAVTKGRGAFGSIFRELRPKVSFRAPDCTQARQGVTEMPLINLIVPLIVVGVVLWLINRYIPMAQSIKTILNVVVVVFVGIWVLQSVGLWSPLSNYRLHG